MAKERNSNGIWRTVALSIALPLAFAFAAVLWQAYSNRIEVLEASQTTQQVSIAAHQTRIEYLERNIAEIKADVKELLKRTPSR